GPDSHLPDTLRPARVAGLGLNQKELDSNPALTENTLLDLNKQPRLPYPEASFDAVLCSVSIDYLTRPAEVFSDVARVLKPGGLFLVTFSNRMFPGKAVRVWRESSEPERVAFVECLFRKTPGFEEPTTWISKNRPRPADDKYAGVGIPSDPVYAVFADKRGGERTAPRRAPPKDRSAPDEATVQRRKGTIQQTRCCSYCEHRLLKWEMPQTAFTEWPNDFFYVCFNDECSYFLRGWDAMSKMGATCSYRLMWDPLRDACLPVPVFTRQMLRDGIIE
ncbi:MAG: class I SAM-dependent methyltransferase, partial [bacterium]|nr:class I SAM-dependent methyltransferase [bacterium]